MTRVYVADGQSVERSAFRLLLNDLHMQVAGEAGRWDTVMAEVPEIGPDVLLVEWDVLPQHSATVLEALRASCKKGMVIILLFNYLDASQQADLSRQVDLFMSKLDSPQRITGLLRAAALDNGDPTEAKSGHIELTTRRIYR